MFARCLLLLCLALLPGSLSLAQPALVRRTSQNLQIKSSSGELTVDLTTGRFQLTWQEHAAVKAACGAIRLRDGHEYKTTEYASHTCEAKDVIPVKDKFGSGTRITLHHRQTGAPNLNQIFTVYATRPEVYVQLEAVGAETGTILASNHIAPVVVEQGTGSVDLESGDPLQVLFVPFDNDEYVRYTSQNWGPEADSFEVTALYDNTSRGGLVLGSVDHDLWKTGFAMRNRKPRTLGGLRIYNGATGYWSHDKEPHGTVEGHTIRSSRIFIAWFPDWRNGMEQYGKANALIKPALAWTGGTPFGWNSWGAYKTQLKAPGPNAAVDFFADPTMASTFKSASPNFINLDAFWDYLKPEDLQAFIKKAHANGQKIGIYWTPFAAWGDDLNTKVEGIDAKYTYRDLTLKDSKGEPLPRVDNGWPLDPTHPGLQARNAYYYKKFIDWGFDFVKLDFLSHAAEEGVRYDKKVPTGIAAYNLGMQQIVETFDPKRIGRPCFLSLGIAPLFPQGYGHARRMSCDAFSHIGLTEYLLNSLTYGWWVHDTIYPFNDPDQSVVYKTAGEDPVPFAEGQSRLTASVITGGMLIESDDLTDPAAKERVRALFTNPEVIALARKGRTFRPVEGDTGTASTDTFALDDPGNKTTYIAVFNFNGSANTTKSLDLKRLGLDASARYRVHNLWTNQDSSAQGTLRVELAPAQCALLRFTQD